MSAIPDIDYQQVRQQCGKCIHKGRSVAQADLYVLEFNGKPALLKTFRDRPSPVRYFWGKQICRREVRALRRLGRLAGVPHLLATAGPYAFVMERLEAVRLPRKKETPPPECFWEDARRLIDELHGAGVAHGDLRRTNILMSADGRRAFLIDFATAVRRRDRGLQGWLARRVFRHMRRIDRVTFARIKHSYAPDDLDSVETIWLNSEPWFLKAGRWFKRYIYRLRKPHVLRHRLRFLWRWVMVKLGFESKLKRFR